MLSAWIYHDGGRANLGLPWHPFSNHSNIFEANFNTFSQTVSPAIVFPDGIIWGKSEARTRASWSQGRLTVAPQYFLKLFSQMSFSCQNTNMVSGGIIRSWGVPRASWSQGQPNPGPEHFLKPFS